jgi:hypothetical protein
MEVNIQFAEKNHQLRGESAEFGGVNVEICQRKTKSERKNIRSVHPKNTCKGNERT